MNGVSFGRCPVVGGQLRELQLQRTAVPFNHTFTLSGGLFNLNGVNVYRVLRVESFEFNTLWRMLRALQLESDIPHYPQIPAGRFLPLAN